MSTATPPSPVSPAGRAGALAPTLEELIQNTRLLISLRWLAGAGILAGALIAWGALGLDLKPLPLVIIGAAVLAYNAALRRILAQPEPPLALAQRVAWGQIILDWLAMLALVHFTGGITSPALLYFVIHAALAGAVLRPRDARALALLAVVLLGGLAWLERSGALPHVRIRELGLAGEQYRDWTYIGAVLFFFGTTALVLSELITWTTQRLRQREERIRQLYEARATFVRVATHELRAPLGASLSLMRNIEQGYAGDLSPQQAAILGRVTARLEGLRTLIDDLLTLAASREASAAHAPLQPEDVRATLERLVERERPSAEQKRLALDCRFDDPPGLVLAGDVGLNIIFGNLLNNAIKYTPEGGAVTLDYAVHPDERAVVVTLRDSGIGIPAADLPNIFGEFYRAQNVRSGAVMGTGIGLATVRTLVERYQGRIELASEEGRGTTVTVWLPLATRGALGEQGEEI